MSDDWRTTFPSQGAAEQFRMKMHSIVGKLEGRDFSGAQQGLRRWESHLDFGGVPPEVMVETRVLLDTALSWVRAAEAGSAIASVESALDLWRVDGPVSPEDAPGE